MAEFDPTFTSNPSVPLPALAAGGTVTGGAGAWALAAATAQIVAAGGAPAAAFTIDAVHLDTPSGAMLAELRLYYGPTDILCGAVAFEVATDAGVIATVPVKTSIIPAGVRVHGNMATAAGGAQTINVKVSTRLV
jgi:hypothetical protein